LTGTYVKGVYATVVLDGTVKSGVALETTLGNTFCTIMVVKDIIAQMPS